ncbi:MAG: heme ABC exporter ATP-binding protein CcmA [Bryobacterales bacterium]|nr:heme ABC exporter ATP-binding protein CcmA [Bryobacterales bacterium]
MNAVEARGLTRFFGVYAALRRVSFAVPPGQCVALLGRNGAGKTTLLRLLAGINSPSEGSLEVFGGAPEKPATRKAIGFLGHGSGLYDELNAEENLMLAARVHGLAEPAAIAKQWLERVDLQRLARSRPSEFSRGMRQRLALARVLLAQPRLLLLDEPLTALDDRATRMVRELLEHAWRGGTTLFMSTHHLSEGMQIASHILLLDRGRVAYSGERTPEMLANPAAVYELCGESA